MITIICSLSQNNMTKDWKWSRKWSSGCINKRRYMGKKQIPHPPVLSLSLSLSLSDVQSINLSLANALVIMRIENISHPRYLYMWHPEFSSIISYSKGWWCPMTHEAFKERERVKSELHVLYRIVSVLWVAKIIH